MSSVPPTPTELGRIAGPLIVGYLLNWGLFGVLTVQVYIYHLAFPKDRKENKMLVYGTYLLETFQTILIAHDAFTTFASGFGNPESLDEVGLAWFSVPLMTGIIAFIAQTFYAYRVSVLAQSKYIAALIMLLAFLQFSGALAAAIEAKKAVHWSHFLTTRVLIIAAIWEGGSAACDVVIAAAMTYYLKKRDTGMKETQLILTKVIQLTVETGTLTASIAIICLILGFLPGHPTYYQAGVSVLGKMYSNSMMVAFNSRMKIMSPAGNSQAREGSIPLSQVSRMRRDSMDFDLSRSMHGGVLITRNETTDVPLSHVSVSYHTDETNSNSHQEKEEKRGSL